jgi:ankyrin repeat protein
MINDELGNDPLFICDQNNNYDFIFIVLLEGNNTSFNSTNNEGKSIIHLILNISKKLNEYKKDTLLKAIKSGFDFNIKDNDGILPIDYASFEGDEEIVNILKDCYKNAGIEIKEKKNYTSREKKKL